MAQQGAGLRGHPGEEQRVTDSVSRLRCTDSASTVTKSASTVSKFTAGVNKALRVPPVCWPSPGRTPRCILVHVDRVLRTSRQRPDTRLVHVALPVAQASSRSCPRSVHVLRCASCIMTGLFVADGT